MDFFYSNIEKYRSEFKKMITIMLEREKDVGIIISYYNKEIDAWNLYIYYSTKFVIFRSNSLKRNIESFFFMFVWICSYEKELTAIKTAVMNRNKSKDFKPTQPAEVVVERINTLHGYLIFKFEFKVNFTKTTFKYKWTKNSFALYWYLCLEIGNSHLLKVYT